jgi:ribosome recycling factor
MDPIVNEASGKMDKSIQSYQGSLAKLRSGRANPAILSGIMCDYYGDKMDITTLCSISMPEPRQLLVKPYSRDDLKTVATAISLANIGINPQIEADAIRLIVPPLTEEIRKDIAKQAKGIAEEAKVTIRNIRRDYLDLVKEDDTMSDDYKERVQDDIQKSVDAANKQIDDILVAKTKEIMSI